MIKDMNPESASEEAGESKEYEKHEIENAADTLTKAEEIKKNKSLHGHAMKHLAAKGGHIQAAMKGHEISMGTKPASLKELRSIASKKSAEIDDAG